MRSKTIMIYSDKYAFLDCQVAPAKRKDDDACLNCHYCWAAHHGWGCRYTPGKHTFDLCAATERYETASMRASIGAGTAIAGTKINMPAIARGSATTIIIEHSFHCPSPPSRECPCGILRVDCEYHR